MNLATVLAGNPTREFFVRLTDGSPADGWGPGLFWMAVHSGPITLETDRLVFDQLRTTQGDPQGYGAALLYRRYPVNGEKTLTRVHLPTHPTTESSRVHLLAATLSAATPGDPPKLVANATLDGRVRLSWPEEAAGYQLKTAPNLGATISWTSVTETPIAESGLLTLTVAPNNPAGYYRLEPATSP